MRKYSTPQITISKFQKEDVITSSGRAAKGRLYVDKQEIPSDEVLYDDLF